jgi:hypothetical protein
LQANPHVEKQKYKDILPPAAKSQTQNNKDLS